VYVIQTQVDFVVESALHYSLGLPQEGVSDNLNLAAVFKDREVGIMHMGLMAGYISHRGYPGHNDLLVKIISREPTQRRTTIHIVLREIKQDTLELGEIAAVLDLYVTTGHGEPVRVTFGKLNTNPAGSPLISL